MDGRFAAFRLFTEESVMSTREASAYKKRILSTDFENTILRIVSRRRAKIRPTEFHAW